MYDWYVHICSYGLNENLHTFLSTGDATILNIWSRVIGSHTAVFIQELPYKQLHMTLLRFRVCVQIIKIRFHLPFVRQKQVWDTMKKAMRQTIRQ
jgi:hypothetical protein